eukprot:TRINITY_DN8915_c0_g2_i1.p1 TRINITY_DN8915_c0_g2~~TRINITY_DN8915_c0_g2_i1.p1  ORF type:complete len:659 (+),score=244.78 TRINITY_DN8915_c0_g2_i1:46-1977(+)
MPAADAAHDCESFLREAGLQDYVSVFAGEGFTCREDVSAVTDAQLAAMGVAKVGERARVLRLIARCGRGASVDASFDLDSITSAAHARAEEAARRLSVALSVGQSLAAAFEESEAAARAHFALLRATVDAREQQLLGVLHEAATTVRTETDASVDAIRVRLAAERSVCQLLDDALRSDSIDQRRAAAGRAHVISAEPLPEAPPRRTALPRFVSQGVDQAEAAVMESGGIMDLWSCAAAAAAPERPDGCADGGGRRTDSFSRVVTVQAAKSLSPRRCVVDRVKLTSLKIDGYFSAAHVGFLDKGGAEVFGNVWYFSEVGSTAAAEFDAAQNALLETAFQSDNSLPNGHPGFETDDFVCDFTDMTRQDKKAGDDGKKKLLKLVRKTMVVRASSAAFGTSVSSATTSSIQRQCWRCRNCDEAVKRLSQAPNGKGESWLCANAEQWLVDDGTGARIPITDEPLRLKISEGHRAGDQKVDAEEHVYDLDRMVRVDKAGDRKKARLYRENRCSKWKLGCGAKEPAYGCAQIDDCKKRWMERWEGLPDPVSEQLIGSKAGWSLAYCDECFAKSTQVWSALSTRPGEWLQVQLPRAKPVSSFEYVAVPAPLRYKIGGNVPHRMLVEAFHGTRQVLRKEVDPDSAHTVVPLD